MQTRQLMVFRSPDWEDGYGGDLLTEPPPERTAWLDPDDRDGLAALLLECARDTIARVGWGGKEAETTLPIDRGFSPDDPKYSPIWRRTPNGCSRWAGHVWDACTVSSDGYLRILLRLTVRFVDWRLDGVSTTQLGFQWEPSSCEAARLRPYISPDIKGDCYSLTHAWELKRPVVLYVCDDWEDVRTAGDRAIAPDDRDAIEKVLTTEATRAIEEWEADFDVPLGMKPDSHFGRWLAARQQHSERALDWDRILDDDKMREAALAAYEASNVPEVLPSKWAGWAWEAWGDEPGDEHRDGESAGALYLRLIVRDVVWQAGRVARLVYDLEPKLKFRSKECVQNTQAASVAPGLLTAMSPAGS